MQRKRWGIGVAGRSLTVALLLVLALLQAPAPAQAARNIYSVRDIAVNKQAQSGQVARDQGLAEARQAAFTHLFQRLVPQSYHRAEPALTQDQLLGLIAAVDVIQEQTTATNYRAQLTMAFAPAQVQQLLNSRSIPFSDQPSPPLLIVPVYDWAGARQLWEVPNPWHDAWSEDTGSTGLITTVMAEGTAEEQLLLSADQALAGDSDGLQQIARSYNADGAVVALGRFRVDAASGKPVLDVTLKGYGAAPAGPLTRRFEGNPGSRAGLAAEQLTRTAAKTMTAELDDAWKADNLQRSGPAGNTLLVSVPLAYIGDYASVLRRINEVSAIESAVVARITQQEAQFRLTYRYSLEQVQRAFDQLGMPLVQEPGGWVLRING